MRRPRTWASPAAWAPSSFQRTVWYRLPESPVATQLTLEATGRTLNVVDLAAFVQPAVRPAPPPATHAPARPAGRHADAHAHPDAPAPARARQPGPVPAHGAQRLRRHRRRRVRRGGGAHVGGHPARPRPPSRPVPGRPPRHRALGRRRARLPRARGPGHEAAALAARGHRRLGDAQGRRRRERAQPGRLDDHGGGPGRSAVPEPRDRLAPLRPRGERQARDHGLRQRRHDADRLRRPAAEGRQRARLREPGRHAATSSSTSRSSAAGPCGCASAPTRPPVASAPTCASPTGPPARGGRRAGRASTRRRSARAAACPRCAIAPTPPRRASPGRACAGGPAPSTPAPRPRRRPRARRVDLRRRAAALRPGRRHLRQGARRAPEGRPHRRPPVAPADVPGGRLPARGQGRLAARQAHHCPRLGARDGSRDEAHDPSRGARRRHGHRARRRGPARLGAPAQPQVGIGPGGFRDGVATGEPELDRDHVLVAPADGPPALGRPPDRRPRQPDEGRRRGHQASRPGAASTGR